MLAMQSERLTGLFAYFAEEGLTIDGQVVSSVIKPDNNPVTNWSPLGTAIPGFAFAVETTDDKFLAPQPGGGYRTQVRDFVTGDTFTATFREQSEPVHRLEFGVAAALVNTAAQAPHTSTNRMIRGWLHAEGRVLGGTNLFMFDWWCELRLSKPLNRDEKVAPVELMFRKLESALNSVVMP